MLCCNQIRPHSRREKRWSSTPSMSCLAGLLFCCSSLSFLRFTFRSSALTQWESQASSQSFPDVGHAALRGLVTEAETLAQNRATKALESREQAAHQALARLELDVAFQKQLLQQRREVPRGAFAATTAVNPTVSHPQIPPPPPQGVPLHHESSASAAPQLTKMQQGGFSNGTTTNGGSMPLRQPGASLVTAAAASGSFSSGSSVSHTKEPQFAWRPAVVVMAHNRPEYLSRSLGALLGLVAAQGEAVESKWCVYVSLDAPSAFDKMKQAVATVQTQRLRAGVQGDTKIPVGVFELRAVSGKGGCDALCAIARHVKFAMDQTFLAQNRQHTHVALLEEDLLPGTDFLHLFEATAWLLEADKTLWCVSAWNDNGLLPHAQNDALLTRTSWFPGLGWMMPRQQWEPLSSRWPKAATTGWDHWIRRSANSGGGLECIIPEVSRTKHIATHGTNVGAAEQRRYAQFQLSQRLPGPPLPLRGGKAIAASEGTGFGDLGYLMRENYDAQLANLIASSPRLDAAQARSGSSSSGSGAVVVLADRGSYNDVGKKLNLVYSEQRTMHSGVVLARSNSPSSGGSGISSDLNSDRSLAANNRILVVDRRKGADFLQPDEAWRPHPSVVTLPANRGQSCDARCKGVGKRCDNRELEFVNNCDAVLAAFACQGGCGHQIGIELPAYVSDHRASTYGQCLVTDGPMPRCGATHPSTERLCACL